MIIAIIMVGGYITWRLIHHKLMGYDIITEYDKRIWREYLDRKDVNMPTRITKHSDIRDRSKR